MNGVDASMRVAESFAAWAWRASWQGAILAAAVALVVWVTGKRISPAWRFALWALVLVRLAMPALVEVRWGWNTPKPHTAALGVRELSEQEFQAAVAEASAQVTPTGSGAVGASATIVSKAPKAPDRFSWTTQTVRRTKPLLIITWLAGIALFAVRVLLASLRLSGAVRRTRPITDPRVLDLITTCCREMNVRRAPQARELPAGAGPALVGFLRPKILLPLHATQHLGDDELRLIILHELAHVRRRDVLVNWLATLIAIVHWANPAVWLVIWRMRAERELACDEMVLRAGDRASGRAYANTIMKLVEALSGTGDHNNGGWAGRAAPAAARQPLPSGAVGILEGRAQLQRRLQMIARFDSAGPRWPAVAAVTLSLFIGGLALTGATRAADPADNQKPGASPAKPAAAGDAAPKARPESPILDDLLNRPNPPSDEEVNQAKAKLWKEIEKHQIFVNGELKNADAVRREYEVQAKVLTDAVEEAKRAGKWAATPRSAPVVGAPVPDGPRTAAFRDYTRTTSPEDDAVNARTAQRLKKNIEQINFQGVGLSDVIDFIRDATNIDIMVEWHALEEAGITKDAPVTLRLREPAPADAVLTLIFRSLGAPLKHEVDKGVVVITTADRQAPQVTRVYDVSDLLAGPLTAGHDNDPHAAPPARGGGGGGGFGGNGPELPPEQQLITLITSTVHPTDWMSSGGSVASIATFKNKLVVKAPEAVHREVNELLEMLREKPANRVERTTATEKPH